MNKENVKNKILDILKNNAIYIVGCILIVYKSLLLNTLIDLDIEKEVVGYSILAAVLFLCPLINNKNKFSYIYFNIVYTIITLIIFANFVYYKYATNFLSLYQLANLQYSKEITSGFLSIINFKVIITFWIDNILIIGLSVYLYKKYGSSKYKNKILKTILIAIIILLNIFLVHTKVRDLYENREYNKSLVVKGVSIFYYHYEDARDYIISLMSKEEVDEERLQQIYDEYIDVEVEENEYTGIAEDSNVIIVQMESLAEYVIGKEVNGKEITPNLNKFFSENIYCTNMYNQGLGSTADSEFEMENSMYPLENGYVFQKYYDNTWNDIYSTLREEGYYTSFMHPNTSTYWNREEVYNTGYNIDEYDDIKSFPDIEQAGEFYSDEGFFEEAVKKMSSYEGKFCTTLVTVTSHIPFYLDGVSDLESKITLTQEDVADFEDETFRNYLISCNFVDYAFGQFLSELEEAGLLENSILVVYGDHGPGLSCTEDFEKFFNENGEEYTEFFEKTKDVHIPFGISVPGDENISINISETVAKIDIKPTIMDLLGLEDSFSIGKTIFSGKDYSFIKGLGFITSDSYYINGIYYDRKTGKEIEETDELASLLKQMEDEIYLSDMIIKNNLLYNYRN